MLAMVKRTNWVACGLVGLVSILVLAVGGLLLMVSRPEKLGFAPGSVKLQQAQLNGKRVIIVTGDPANYLGQLQGIGVEVQGKRIYLHRFVVRWHPFAQLAVHQDWPVVLPAQELDPG